MGFYAENPHDQPEAPYCSECDERMVQTGLDFFGEPEWECSNPDCENCARQYLQAPR